MDEWNPYSWTLPPENEGDPDPYTHWDEVWGGRIRCCIRAGIDVAADPSAGVVGFTVCDLRRMYPKGIPTWINTGFQDGEGNAVDLNAGECAVGIWL